MNFNDGLLLSFIVTVMAGLTVQFIRYYLLERQSPLPFFPGIKAQGSYQYLAGTWYQHHITRNSYINNGEPCWSSDIWEIKVKDGFRVSGVLKVQTTHQANEYYLVGEIREGRLLITGSAREAPQDFFTAIFPDLVVLARHDPMIGTMMAFDYQGDFYISPMILHKTPNLDANTLNRFMRQYAHPEKPIDYINIEKRKADKMLVDLIQSDTAAENTSDTALKGRM